MAKTKVARKLRETFASRFVTGIGIRSLWKLSESHFHYAFKNTSLKTRWKLTYDSLQESHFHLKNSMS